MIDYFSALKKIFDTVSLISLNDRFDIVDLDKSLGCISFNSIFSNTDIPYFNSSAMDGYALNYNDINNYIGFELISSIKAGDKYNNFDFFNGSVVEIMTGAMIPSCYDTVVKFEDTYFKVINDKKIVFLKSHVKKGDNIKIIGDDYKKGDIILQKGDKISNFHLSILSALGINKINVFKKIKIYLICTGNEIRDYYFNFDTSIEKNIISNFNGPYIKSFLNLIGFDVFYLGVSLDTTSNIKKLFESFKSYDEVSLFITTGAVSKGTTDFLPGFLKSIGSDILFHGVNIKPGKPILFSKYDYYNYFFCLPGNPIASIVGLRFFVYYFLKFITGFSFEKPIKAKLLNNFYISDKNNFYSFLKSFLYIDKGIAYVNIIDEQESFKTSGLSISNSFVFLKPDSFFYRKNDLLNVYYIDVFYD